MKNLKPEQLKDTFTAALLGVWGICLLLQHCVEGIVLEGTWDSLSQLPMAFQSPPHVQPLGQSCPHPPSRTSQFPVGFLNVLSPWFWTNHYFADLPGLFHLFHRGGGCGHPHGQFAPAVLLTYVSGQLSHGPVALEGVGRCFYELAQEERLGTEGLRKMCLLPGCAEAFSGWGGET